MHRVPQGANRLDFLTVITPDGARSQHNFEGETLRIGRSSRNDLILQDENASRLHAEVARCPGGHLLVDLRSKNGTFLNDRKIDEPVPLRHGDQVRIGATLLVFNATSARPVTFTDLPLRAGSETTFLPASEVPRPATDVALAAETPPELAWTPTADQAATSRFGRAPETQAVPPHSISQIILATNAELLFHRPLDEILEKVMDLAYRAVCYERGLLMLLKDGEFVVEVRRVAEAPSGETMRVSGTILEHVRRTHESILTADALVDERFVTSESIGIQQVRSLMCVPLLGTSEMIGAIYVDSREQAGLFTERDLRILAFLANLAAVKIENARLFQEAVEHRRRDEELREAARIQTHLLPASTPQIPGYSLDGSTFPCHEVGGDYYDYAELPDGRFGIALADVAGKGLPAALLMCGFQAGLRALCDLQLPLEETMDRLNRLLCRYVPENRYITFFYGILDVASHSLTYVNAGQTPPLVVRDGTAIERLELSGLPLGSFCDLRFRADRIVLEPGDLLVCYSDGVTEALDPSGQMFGEERLVAGLREGRDGKPSDILARVLAAVDRHGEGAPHQDDITLVILKREGAEPVN